MPRKSENRFLKKKIRRNMWGPCMHACMFVLWKSESQWQSEEKTVMLMRNTVLCGGRGSQRGPPATRSLWVSSVAGSTAVEALDTWSGFSQMSSPVKLFSSCDTSFFCSTCRAWKSTSVLLSLKHLSVPCLNEHSEWHSLGRRLFGSF